MSGHRHLVAALDDGGHLALHRNPARRGRRERLARLGAPLQPVRQTDLVARGDDGGFDLVPDAHPQLSVVLGQLGTINPGLALAADVDEDMLGRDLDDPSLDDLTDLQGRPRLLAREHRGKIFRRLFTHDCAVYQQIGGVRL